MGKLNFKSSQSRLSYLFFCCVCVYTYNPTDPVTISELQNLSYDAPRSHKICRSSDLESLKLWKAGREGLSMWDFPWWLDSAECMRATDERTNGLKIEPVIVQMSVNFFFLSPSLSPFISFFLSSLFPRLVFLADNSLDLCLFFSSSGLVDWLTD